MRSPVALFAVLILAASCSGKTDGKKLGPAPYALSASSDARTIVLSRGTDTLLTFPADAFEIGVVNALDEQVSYDPFWLEAKDNPLYVEPQKDLRFLNVASASFKSGALSIDESFSPGVTASVEVSLDQTSTVGAAYTMKVVPETKLPIAYIRIRLRVEKDEAFYGLGEVPDELNHRGKLRPMQIEVDGSTESSDNEVHVPIPLLIGTRGWGVFVESRRFGVFDVARKADDLVEITYGTAEESANGLVVHIFAADHPLDITKHYYDVTGYPRLPATWAYGPWIWRDEFKDQAQFERDVRTIRELDLATSGMWVDRPYERAVNTFDFDPARYSDPRSMIARARDAGIRVAAWSSPYLEASASPLVDEATSKGYFIPTHGILLNQWGVPIDFTNHDAFAFWQTQIAKLVEMGIEGFKLDYGEDIVGGLGGARLPWLFADGSDERTEHYGYTMLYHKAYADKLPETGAWLLGRAGRWGDQARGVIVWPGDLDATLTKRGERVSPPGEMPYNGTGGLSTSLTMGLSLGPSGFPFYSSDTGGYRHSPANKETFIRWFEQSALFTSMEIGNESSETPWEMTPRNGHDQATVDLYRESARLHLRLFPYVWTYASNLAKDGRAIARAEGLAYPDLGVHPNDVYLLGDALLVAPVITAGETTKSIVFPPGGWIDWQNGERHEGGPGRGAEMVSAPLEKLPLYLKTGGIVPMLRPTIDTLSPVGTSTLADTIESYAKDPGRVWVRIGRGGDGSFSVFDGTSIAIEEQSNGATVHVKSGSTFSKGAVLELVASSAAPSAVMIDGVALSKLASASMIDSGTDGWAFVPDVGGTIWISVPSGEHHVRMLP